MNYNSLYSDFRALFPEEAYKLDLLAAKANADEEDGMHVMFSFVVIPFILEALNTGNTELLKRAFDFFDKMAADDSADITEVLEFTVIENLIANGRMIYEEAKRYMGAEMLNSCKRVESYMDVGE